MTTISMRLEGGTSKTSLIVLALRVVEVSKFMGVKDEGDGSVLLFIREPFADEVVEQLKSAGFHAIKVERGPLATSGSSQPLSVKKTSLYAEAGSKERALVTIDKVAEYRKHFTGGRGRLHLIRNSTLSAVLRRIPTTI
jgi:hypothetical protein